MTAIDATGLQALEHLASVLKESGRQLILCGAREQPAKLMEQAEFHRHIGDENIQTSLQGGADRARALLSKYAPESESLNA
jgi:SulP family sulfate permease